MKQEYVGCKKLDDVERISPSIAPREFFSKYIASRTPVAFNGFITDTEWKVSKESWSYDNLIRRTPDDMTVKVEYRASDSDRFGLGKEKTIPFHEFITDIANGATNLYMTTQELEYDLEDQPEIISAPLTALKQDFPLIPSLFGNLVISNINLWIGRSSSWTTSGLHHDYHDNLYIMLKGQKQITLISPAFTEDLYTVGEIDIIHPNGRINYVGQPTFADGRSLDADKAWSAAQKLKRAMEEKMSIHRSGGKRFGKATAADDDDEDEEEGDDEDEIDKALEEVLEAEFDGEGDDDDFDEDDDFEDDYDEDEEDDGEDAFDDSSDDDRPQRKRPLPNNASNGPNKKSKGESTTTSTRPDNFSQVDTSLPSSQLKTQFPRYAKAAKTAVTVTLKEGEMLFIPAGWFHEVKSQGSEGHIAFNYWFHPPDQLNNFEKPYSSDFWPSVLQSKLLNSNSK